MFPHTVMYIVSIKIFEFITLEFEVFVLFDPLRSADPPINCGRIDEMFSIILDEHCLVAKLGLVSKYFDFFSKINFSKFFKSELI